MRAYFDSMYGLAAIKVLSFNDDNTVRTIVTANNHPLYRRNEIYNWPVWRVVPRNAVRKRKHGTTIMPYDLRAEFAKHHS